MEQKMNNQLEPHDLDHEVDPAAIANKKTLPSLADMRRQEQVESLSKLDDKALLEMVQAHFKSHPTLPGEKDLKKMANDGLKNEGTLSDTEMAYMVNGYAQTRIRETKFEVTAKDFSPDKLDITPMYQDGPVSMGKANVNLMKTPSGNVCVAVQQGDQQTIFGKLPDKFLINNPMNVDICGAELQVADYSNGKMKNVSMRVVADTDLMSGDVIDLDENMLNGLEQESGLEQ